MCSPVPAAASTAASARLEEIALITNQAIDSNFAVNTIETSLEEAKAMGAMALFGENYGKEAVSYTHLTLPTKRIV